jgi:tol-pal system protein YbgF
MPIARVFASGIALAGALVWAGAVWAVVPNLARVESSPGAYGAVPLLFAQSPADAERFARIEETMRRLTGQVEELTHQLVVLQDQLRRLQEDVEFRLGEVEGAPGAAPMPEQAAASPIDGQADTLGTFATDQPISDADLQLGAPPQPLGQVTIEGPPGSQPLDISTLAGGSVLDDLQPQAGVDQQQLASIAPTGDPRFDYDQAYALIRSGRYDLAETSFRQFLGTYPGDELAPEAQYWLGESYFARGDYARAAEEFRAGYKAYPKSRRGPDTLLKLGLSMAGLGYRDEACQMYAATLKQYPDMSNALLQRVRNEQASASC